jgi:4-amino-4-deoxy-L-arabinose transferase-like glycosyltransferase
MNVLPTSFRNTALAVLIFGLVLRLFTLGLFLSYDQGFINDDDSAGYLSLAENMELGLGFAWDVGLPFTPDSFRTPGYPIFLLAHHAIFGSYGVAIITQILLSLLIALLIMRIGERYFSAKAGIIAAFLFLIMPFSLLVSLRFITQVTFTVSLIGALYAWLKYLESSSQRYLIIAAVLLPVVALIRPIAIWIVAPLVAAMILAVIWRKLELRRMLYASAILIAIFVVGLAPWLYRNYVVFGTASLSSLPAFQLYFYDAPSIYATSHDISYADARKALDSRIEEVTGYSYKDNVLLYTEFSPLTPVLVSEGLAIAFSDPVALIETRAVQFFKFFVRDGIRYWIERYGIDTQSGWGFVAVVFERCVLFVIMLGFFYASVRAFLEKNVAHITIAFVALYFAVLTGVMASAGLRYPAEPIILLLGTWGLFLLYSQVRKRITTL